MTNLTRRFFLGRAALSVGAAAATTTVAVATAPSTEALPQSLEHFKHPDEYIVAMRQAGMRAVAAFHFLKDGGVHKMGVIERGLYDLMDEETRSSSECQIAWRQYHSIKMRYPQSKAWSKALYDRLWDLGMRENVRPDYPPAPVTDNDPDPDDLSEDDDEQSNA